MTVAGPSYPGTTNVVSRGGTSKTWTNPGNVGADDATYATSAVTAVETPSYYLDATNLGFALPAGSVVSDVKWEVERKEAGFAQDSDDTVQLILASVATGNNKAAAGEWPTADTIATYNGDPVSYWGVSALSETDINSSGFGLRFAVLSAFNGLASVDFIRCTVTYSASSAGKGAPIETSTRLYTQLMPRFNEVRY